MADGSVKDTLQGKTHKGEENTENVARRLIARLNQDGAQYGEPKKPVTEQGVDWVADDGREKLSIQVTRIGDKKFFEKFSQLREQAQLGGTDEAADRLLAAIILKAKQIPPAQRAELTLALDTIVLPSHTLEPVIDTFRSRHGAQARQLGFKAIWLVGGSSRLTNRLDPPL